MRVWINNPFDFLPGEGARLQRYGLLCQALAQAGHQVVWWTSDWNHLEKARREVLKFESSKALKLKEKLETGNLKLDHPTSNIEHRTSNVEHRIGAGGVEIRLIKTLPYFKNVGLRRLLSHWLYAKRWERMSCSSPVQRRKR